MCKKLLLVSLAVLVLFACKPAEKKKEESRKPWPTGAPLGLTYENVSVILQDMEAFTGAVQKLDGPRTREIDDRYRQVLFGVEAEPLFINVYPDPPYSRIVFLIMPKDVQTGTDFSYNYPKLLPVVRTRKIEIKIRTSHPEEPLVCLMKVPDTAAYMDEQDSHKYVVRFYLRKRFIQSGTFDFDALTIPSYRPRGVPFIAFDLDQAQLTDLTTNKSCDCK
jgi:hypothetical protein